MKKTISLLILIVKGIMLTAQTEYPPTKIENVDSIWLPRTIVSERPTQSTTSSTLPRNTIQIETGFMYESTKTNDYNVDDWVLGTTLLRYGIWDNFEIRLGSYYRMTNIKLNETETETDSTLQGAGPFSAGFKVHIVEEKGLRPEISIVAKMTLRHIGSPYYRPTYSYPLAKIAASHSLTRNLSLGYNAGFAYNGKNADGFFVYSVILRYRIAHRVLLFLEGYGTFDHGDHPNHRIDGGVVFSVRKNLQIDISAGTGFDDYIDKSFASTGFSWRIPH